MLRPWLNLSLVRVTEAPGITPPELSITIPETTPVMLCPFATVVKASIANTTDRISTRRRLKLDMGVLLQLERFQDLVACTSRKNHFVYLSVNCLLLGQFSAISNYKKK